MRYGGRSSRSSRTLGTEWEIQSSSSSSLPSIMTLIVGLISVNIETRGIASILRVPGAKQN